MNPLAPSAALLAKLGSIIIHFDEYRGADGHYYDLASANELLRDAEVVEWLAAMDAAAMLPKMRGSAQAAVSYGKKGKPRRKKHG